MSDLDSIKYGLDADLFKTLMDKLRNRDQEIIALKMHIKDLESKLPRYSIRSEPDFISIEHQFHNLRLASQLDLETYNDELHIIGRVFETKKHPQQNYQYFLSEPMFELAPLHQKEMILLNMHTQLVHEVMNEYKRRHGEPT